MCSWTQHRRHDMVARKQPTDAVHRYHVRLNLVLGKDRPIHLISADVAVVQL
jgi:hypothetical protein